MQKGHVTVETRRLRNHAHACCAMHPSWFVFRVLCALGVWYDTKRTRQTCLRPGLLIRPPLRIGRWVPPNQTQPEQSPGKNRIHETRRCGRGSHQNQEITLSQASTAIGIDGSKARRDISVLPTERRRRIAAAAQIAALILHLHARAPARSVIAASGGYEAAAPLLPVQAGAPVARVNPRRGPHSARARGRLTKTDRLERHGAARCAQRIHPPLPVAPSSQNRQRSVLLTRRRPLADRLVAERKRRDAAHPAARPSINQHRAWRADDIDTADWRMPARRDDAPERKQQAASLEEAPGVGLIPPPWRRKSLNWAPGTGSASLHRREERRSIRSAVERESDVLSLADGRTGVRSRPWLHWLPFAPIRCSARSITACFRQES